MEFSDFLKRVHLGGLHEKFVVINKNEGGEKCSFAYTRTEDKLLGIFADGPALFDTDTTIELPIYESSRLIQMLGLIGQGDTDIVYDDRTGEIPRELKMKGENGRRGKFILADSTLFAGEPFKKITTDTDGIDPLTEPIVLTSETISTLKKSCSALGMDTFTLVLTEDDGVKLRVGSENTNNFETTIQETIDWKVDPTNFEATFQAAPIFAITQYNDIDNVTIEITDKVLLINVEDVDAGFFATYVLVRYHKNN